MTVDTTADLVSSFPLRSGRGDPRRELAARLARRKRRGEGPADSDDAQEAGAPGRRLTIRHRISERVY